MNSFLFFLALVCGLPLFAATADTGTLTEAEALKRSNVVSDVEYALAIDTTQSDKVFGGNVSIDFSLKKLDHDLRVDTTDGSVIKVNLAHLRSLIDQAFWEKQ